MAGSITITEPSDRAGVRPVRRYSLAWTSDAAGDVNGVLTPRISGELLRAVFIPGAGGDQPTNLYDVTLIVQADGIDLLAGQGANLANNANTHVKPGVPFKDGTTTTTAPIAVDDSLELKVANAGNAKKGTVVLYVQ